MQKLRPPAFRRRSRTPTPQEMRTTPPCLLSGGPPPPVACCSSCNPGASSSLAGGTVDWCSKCRQQQKQQQLRGSVESLGAVSGCPPSPSPTPTSWSLRQQSEELSTARRTSFLLQLPSDPVPISGGDNNRARSRSFDWSLQHNSGDSCGGGVGSSSASGPLFGMLRRSFSRNSSTTSDVAMSNSGGVGGVRELAPPQSAPSVCVHCQCVEEYERLYGSGSATNAGATAVSTEWNNDQQRNAPNWNELEGGDDQDEEEDGDEEEEGEEEDLLGFDDSCSRYGGGGGGGGPASTNTSVRLSFLGDSFECRQKVEPWIRKINESETSISGVGAASLLRRGRSLGLAPYDTASSSGTMSSHLLPSSAISGGLEIREGGGGGAGNQLRRGGSECHNRLPSVDVAIGGSAAEQWQQQHQRPQLSTCSFNFSSFSSTISEPPSSHYPVSPFQSTDASDVPCNNSKSNSSYHLDLDCVSPSPCGTPRLERQEALRSGWLGVSSEPSIDGGRGGGGGGAAPSLSMETHASASLEVDSGACGGSVSQMQQVSFESQYSTATAPPPSRSSSRHRISSFESETSIDSATSGPGGAGARGRLCRSPLLSRRKCLSAGASPCSSPPICLSNSRHNLTGRNLCTGSSSEYGDQPDQSPSPPAEIYLTVPNILVAAPPTTNKAAAVADAAMTASAASSTSLLDKSRHLRQKFKRHAESSRSSSDSKDTTGAAGIHLPQQQQVSTVAAAVRSQLTAFDSNLAPPFRSRSIEVGLPTAHHHHHVDYHELAGSARRHHWVSRLKKNNPGELEITSENGERRVLRSTPDWTDDALCGDHLWVPTSASGDLCYVADQDCSKTGPRLKCSSCRIVAHITCVPHMKFLCRPTFWDGADLRQYRENTDTIHHWVHRRSQTGKCQNCYKSFQSKLSFGSKEIVAITCSWCKAAYHNKDHCFNIDRLKEPCSLGGNHNIIVPPSWIVKLPARENFKSSLRKSSRGAGGGRNIKNSSRRSKRSGQGEDGAIAPMATEVITGGGGESKRRSFVVKPIPTAGSRPIIVFINPKSGGNQGAKLMQKFQWLLNPRQVFDLTQGGPKAGLEMFRKVPNLRVLACGGDGTAGWVLSILDQIGISPAPPVGVLPLGTGNDLARALGWGGGYTDEPISKILSCMGEAEPVMLDRWELQVEKNEEASQICNDGGDGSHHPSRDTLPLSVVNNYFSFGVDAQIALDFHEAREARPQKFNSRLRNKMFYGQAGGKDLLQRKWKDLSEFVTLECDGKDITGKLREQKVHAVLFLNIPSYGGGTHPWAGNHGQVQATDDGLIEVVGLTTYQLPLLQAGGHGTCLAQCRTARIVTRRVIPMQVDGEACRLNPAIINLQLLNQAPVLAKRRGGFERNRAPIVESLRMHVKRISMADYEVHHYEKEALQAAATPIGVINVNRDAILETVRRAVNGLLQENCNSPNGGGDAEKLESDWCFIDCCTAERVFRVDMGQEHLHYITDITATEDLFILDPLSSSSVNSVQDNEGCSVANGGSSSTAAGLVDDAGIEDMVQLANSQLQKQQQHCEAARIKEPTSPIDVPVDSFLIPSNIKRFGFVEHTTGAVDL